MDFYAPSFNNTGDREKFETFGFLDHSSMMNFFLEKELTMERVDEFL